MSDNPLLARLTASSVGAVQADEAPLRGRFVGTSPDFRRIFDLPRRTVDYENYDLAETVGNMLHRAHSGYDRPTPLPLRPAQAAALCEAAWHRSALVVVPVGGGKCLHGDTELLVPGQGRVRLRDLAGTAHKVVSVDDKGTTIVADAMSAHSGVKDCVEILTKSGARIVLSRDHRVHTWRGWVAAGDVRAGDLFASAREYDVDDYVERFSDADVALAALLLADGGLTKGIVYTKTDSVLRGDCARFIAEVGGESSERRPEGKAPFLNVRGIRGWMTRIGIDCELSKKKRVPAAFWALSKRQCALFVNYFFAGDGHVTDRGFDCVLASRGLLDDLRVMLLVLGVRSRVRKKKTTYKGKAFDAWRLTVTGKDARTFLRVVGPLRGAKETACARLSTDLSTRSLNTNVDVVGVSVAETKEIAVELGMSAYLVERELNATKGQFVGRDKFLSFCERHMYAGKYANTTCFFWDSVTSVTSVGAHEVFDVCVPGYETFFAEGLHVHNSWMAALFACDWIPEWADEASWPQILCKRPVLLMPPGPKAEMLNDVLPTLRKAYRVHPALRVVTYGELQQPDAQKLLVDMSPDLVIADEVHMLKNPTAGRTKRVGAVFARDPSVPFVGLTATLSDGSLRDWSLPAQWTHPPSRGQFVGRWSPAEGASFADDCPLPYSWPELEEWADALDAVVPPDRFCAPGVLKRFCEGGEDHREGFGRRLGDTAGVVLVPHESVDVPLEIRAVNDLDMGPKVREVLEELERSWTIGGEDVPDALTMARKKRELAMGFYYKWVWPSGEPNYGWLDARKAWVGMVRHVIQHLRTGLDTELLVRNATRAETLPKSVQGAAAHALSEWDAAQKVCNGPQTVAEWLSDAVLNYAISWVRHEHGLVWVEHDAVLQQLSKGMPAFGAGDDETLREYAKRTHGLVSAALSRSAHGTGKNLQAWCKNLVLSPSPSGKAWEQMLGRTHRSGQKREVTVDVLLHTDIAKESLAKAVMKAHTIEKTTLVPQKLLRAVATGWSRL